MTLLQLITRETRDYFIGVVELTDRLVVGYVEDPMDIDLSAVVLQHPVEFCIHQKPIEIKSGTIDANLGFVMPLLGTPAQVMLSGDVNLYSAEGVFGGHYISALKHIAQEVTKLRYHPSIISAPPAQAHKEKSHGH